jgi:protein-S-isoprenylcysteine O-methyltransferase Ste14
MGYCLIAKLPWMAAVAGIITFIEYYFIVLHEETLLEEAFGGEYLQYKKDVPRWWVRFKLRISAPKENLREWTRVLQLEIGGIFGTLIALGLLVLKHFVEITFDLWWAIGIVCATVVYTAVHLVLVRLKRRKRVKVKN